LTNTKLLKLIKVHFRYKLKSVKIELRKSNEYILVDTEDKSDLMICSH